MTGQDIQPGNEPSDKARKAGQQRGSPLMWKEYGPKRPPAPQPESAPEDSSDE